MLLVLLAKQKNEEESLFWQSLAGKAVIPAEVVLPTSPPPEAGRPAPSLRSGEGRRRVSFWQKLAGKAVIPAVE